MTVIKHDLDMHRAITALPDLALVAIVPSNIYYIVVYHLTSTVLLLVEMIPSTGGPTLLMVLALVRLRLRPLFTQAQDVAIVDGRCI